MNLNILLIIIGSGVRGGGTKSANGDSALAALSASRSSPGIIRSGKNTLREKYAGTVHKHTLARIYRSEQFCGRSTQ